VSGWFSPAEGGRLEVSFPRYADDDDVQVKRAVFKVDQGSINGTYKITMQVFSGTTLADVSVEFSPSGLKFNPSATLTFVLRGELDPDEVKAYHIEGGTVTEISTAIEEGKKTTTITVKVPNFSIYSLGGND
jgi:hypothetical protein